MPGSTTVAAGVPGFGAVFTGVSAANSTRLEFYAPDGALLFEQAVPPAAGNGTLSFVGVSFPYGEIVGRVRIVSGNTALGPADAGAIDVVVMDDFIYAEPVVGAGTLNLTPQTGRLFRTGDARPDRRRPGLTGTTVTGGRVQLDGYDVTSGFVACLIPGSQSAGQTFRCPVPRGAADGRRSRAERGAQPGERNPSAECGPVDGGGEHGTVTEQGKAEGSRRPKAEGRQNGSAPSPQPVRVGVLPFCLSAFCLLPSALSPFVTPSGAARKLGQNGAVRARIPDRSPG